MNDDHRWQCMFSGQQDKANILFFVKKKGYSSPLRLEEHPLMVYAIVVHFVKGS